MIANIENTCWEGSLQYCLNCIRKEIDGKSYGFKSTLYLRCFKEVKNIIDGKFFGELEDVCWLLAGFGVKNKLNIEFEDCGELTSVIYEELDKQLEEYFG